MFIDEFDSIVTTTKRNQIYYGPTESRKMASSLEEAAADLKVVFDKINDIVASGNALASGYLMPSGAAIISMPTSNLYDLKSRLYEIEANFNKRIHIESEQDSVS